MINRIIGNFERAITDVSDLLKWLLCQYSLTIHSYSYFLKKILENFLKLKVTQLLIGLTICFSQSEVVLPSNLENLYHTIQSFEKPERECGEGGAGKGKMLVKSIFSFSHNVFFPFSGNIIFMSNI